MFTVSVETGFEASHQLLLQDGSKEPLHSHNWTIVADAGSSTLNSIGLVIDFELFRSLLDNITAEFDNRIFQEEQSIRRKRS